MTVANSTVAAAYRLAHVAACLAGNVPLDDPRFDERYFRACLTMLGMIERGAASSELLAYDAKGEGVFDGWRDWFALSLAHMPPYLAIARATEAFQGRA